MKKFLIINRVTFGFNLLPRCLNNNPFLREGIQYMDIRRFPPGIFYLAQNHELPGGRFVFL